MLKLSKVCLSLKKWNLTEQFADELRILSTIRYQEELLLMKEGKTEPLITERPLVVYYGKSFLMKGAALYKQGRYEEAKACIEGYEDLSWFQLLDDLGKREVLKYSKFAKGNRYCIELRLGNTDILDKFIHFLTKYPEHIPDALLVIIEVANTYKLNIDYILERFADTYPPTNQHNVVFAQRHFRFNFQKALYEFNWKRYEEGLDTILYCFSLSILTEKYRESGQCIMLFHKYDKYASHFQKVRFYNILKEGYDREN